jgi:2-C-methyl-D-erythritol 4-phosphate cytidylyltransferase
LVKSAIITAAGSGRRFGEAKQFKKLHGKPLYQYSLDTFIKSRLFDEIILVIPNSKQEKVQKEIKRKYSSQVSLVIGGSDRQDSVKNAIQNSNPNIDLVVIHDAARPFITTTLIEKCIIACETSDGAIIAMQPHDTIKFSKNNIVEKTIDRSNIWMAQTPQAFNKQKILEAYSSREFDDLIVTDESSLMEKLGYKIMIVPGAEKNFKITTFDDWKRAEAELQ